MMSNAYAMISFTGTQIITHASLTAHKFGQPKKMFLHRMGVPVSVKVTLHLIEPSINKN